MDNDIIWIKENETNNIYCCELEKAYLEEMDVVYDVNCIIGSFNTIIIPRARTFKNPVPCTIFERRLGIHNGESKYFLKEVSLGYACYDIEKLK
jgi:hypothetical protein